MTACGLGLAMGLALLAASEFLGEETLHDMLTFNPGNFFTYAFLLVKMPCLSAALNTHSSLIQLWYTSPLLIHTIMHHQCLLLAGPLLNTMACNSVCRVSLWDSESRT